MKPVIIGCRTENFPSDQLDVFKKHQPFGMILFAEPFMAGPEAVHHVVRQFRTACPQSKIFIDMEGGSVNRMKQSFGHGWREIPAARDFADLAERDLDKAVEAITLNAQLIGDDLAVFGIDVDCAPVVDLVGAEVIVPKGEGEKPHATSASLFRRSFGSDPEIVSVCAKAFMEGLKSRGVASVLKHAPGYGRVAVDPHYGLDKIRATLAEMMSSDLIPYIHLKDAPAIMTAHTVYEKIDDLPATRSKKIMSLLRETVGFKGVIIADTIEMNALYPKGFSKTEHDQFGMGLPLKGTLAFLTQAVLGAGCDVVMHSDCSRDFAHTIEVLEAAPSLSQERAVWMGNKMTVQPSISSFDRANALTRLEKLLQI